MTKGLGKVVAVATVFVLLICLIGVGPGSRAIDLRDMELVAAVGFGRNYEEQDRGIKLSVALLSRDRALERQYTDSYYCLGASGETLSAAEQKLLRSGAGGLNFSHAGLLVADVNLTPEDWLEEILQLPEIRPTVYPVVAGGAAAILSGEGGGEISEIYQLMNALEPFGEGIGGVWAVNLQDFAQAFYQPGIAVALPYAEGGKLGALAVYGGGVWQIINDEEGAKAWRLLIRSRYIAGEEISLGSDVAARLHGVKVKTEIKEGGVVYRLAVEAEICSGTGGMSQEELSRSLCDKVAADCLVGLKKSRELGADFLGVGREIWRRDPKMWEKMSADWGDEYLSKVAVDFAVTAKIRFNSL